MDGIIEKVIIEFDPHGSLATTHESQGSDMGLFAGLLGWDTTDERLINSRHFLESAGVTIEIKLAKLEYTHPNTYKITTSNKGELHTIIAISSGGGSIEIVELDEIAISIHGDYYETIILSDHKTNFDFNAHISDSIINIYSKGKLFIAQIKTQRPLTVTELSLIESKNPNCIVKLINPVMPILSGKKIVVPFLTYDELTLFNKDKNLQLWELALEYESARGSLPKNEVFVKMREIVEIIQNSIMKGLKGTSFEDRILGNQSSLFKSAMSEKRLLDGGLLNTIILYVSALMEMKSSMGVIVAAPTAGSCAGLPGAIIGAADFMNLDKDEITKAMLAAGLIGVFIAHKSTFAAEECGCQAECGAGSGMAAAGLVTLSKGTLKEAINAATMALQNILGMICDPVANRVEVPCLGKNVMEASNALSCANMALAGYDPVIPLDEVIETMDKVGRSLPRELRCTALGGLSITKSSKVIENRLRGKK